MKKVSFNATRFLGAVFGSPRRSKVQRTAEVLPARHEPKDRRPVEPQRVSDLQSSNEGKSSR